MTGLLPADVQQRADAEVGAAIRHAIAAAPHWDFNFDRDRRGNWLVSAHGLDFAATGDDLAECANRLTEILESRERVP